MGRHLFPGLLDRKLARDGYDSQQTGEKIDPATWRDNLDHPGDEDTDRGTAGVFHDRARDRSAALWVGTHKPALSGVALAAAGLTLAAVARRWR
ncbi:hypothetical protein OG423_27870 [Micromonospora zamorensis]|uniref:hypothetical protein n=1 Tax=Micromonospora zamorensis TaxID=709883 RepID=UPI00352B09F2|nr:hypothetical protein OG423_27870 [Micromonospora zamorensis]